MRLLKSVSDMMATPVKLKLINQGDRTPGSIAISCRLFVGIEAWGWSSAAPERFHRCNFGDTASEALSQGEILLHQWTSPLPAGVAGSCCHHYLQPLMLELPRLDDVQAANFEPAQQIPDLHESHLELHDKTTSCILRKLKCLKDGMEGAGAVQNTLEELQAGMPSNPAVEQPDLSPGVSRPTSEATRVVVVEGQTLLV
eukprot:CAMPEP_0178409146 /NCGR_PEP_ID=MMETSP0689_2-20121128/20312_1 /TAXON_ID=160604 /ORGANISM="Amphidinium massartii, Strain CS-259" /LENGTH=198 /DNA_ID=CAMNT_0020030279 /DNA_START=691 /DNA_END=1289 /DNA_ORIENTATION=-